MYFAGIDLATELDLGEAKFGKKIIAVRKADIQQGDRNELVF